MQTNLQPSTSAQAGRTSRKVGPFWVFLESPFLPQQAARMFGQSRISSCLSKDRYAILKPAGSTQLQVCSKCPKPTFVLVVPNAAANGRVLMELLCVVAIDSGYNLSQLQQLFVLFVNAGHKRHVGSWFSWRSLSLPRTVGSCPEVEKKDCASYVLIAS
jgi:hypothetical protein